MFCNSSAGDYVVFSLDQDAAGRHARRVHEDRDRCVRAVQSKDARFDGWFYTAVTITGIYCRPSCPVVPPKPEHMVFYPSAAEAQLAGFRACKRCRPDASPGSPSLRLLFRQPLVPDSLFGHLAATAVPGVEEWRDGSYRRTMRLPRGHAIVALRPGPEHISCQLALTDLRDLAIAISRCRRLLDLDADPEAVTELLAADPVLAPQVAKAPGRRVPRTVDADEFAIRAVLGQQVSTAAAHARGPAGPSARGTGARPGRRAVPAVSRPGRARRGRPGHAGAAAGPPGHLRGPGHRAGQRQRGPVGRQRLGPGPVGPGRAARPGTMDHRNDRDAGTG